MSDFDLFEFAAEQARRYNAKVQENAMNMHDAPSDLDYYDGWRERSERCATPDCIGLVWRGSPFIYCVRCLADATEAEQRRQTQAQLRENQVKR